MTQSNPKSNPALSTIVLPLLPLHHKALSLERWQVLLNKDNKVDLI